MYESYPFKKALARIFGRYMILGDESLYRRERREKQPAKNAEPMVPDVAIVPIERGVLWQFFILTSPAAVYFTP